MFDKRKTTHPPKVSHTLTTNKIAHVPTRLTHNPLSIWKTDRRVRVIYSPNTHKIAHVPARGETMCD